MDDDAGWRRFAVRVAMFRFRSMSRHEDHGFLLFETAVALLIAVILLEFVIRLFASQHLLLYGSRDRLAAVALAQRLLIEQRLRTDLAPERQQGVSDGLAWRISTEVVNLAARLHSRTENASAGAVLTDPSDASPDRTVQIPVAPHPVQRALYQITIEVIAVSGQKVDVEGLRSLPAPQ